LVMAMMLGVCLGVGPVTAAGTPSGAKALFFTSHGTSEMVSQGESVTPSMQTTTSRPATSQMAPVGQDRPQDNTSEYMGVSYWIEVAGRDGVKQRVTADRVFRSGERIKLFITTNRDGYLSLLNIGSSGRSRLLYPHAQTQPNENFVQANAQFEVPQGGTIRFDDTPGEETLLLMLSPQPMQNLMPGGGGGAQAYQAPPPNTLGYAAPTEIATMPPTSNAPGYAAPADPGSYAPPPPINAGYTQEQTNQVITVASAKGAKDLVMETDNASAQPASYAVAPMSSLGDSGMITLQIKLKHR
jgi:Domain of unknown function (DUF4384)